MADQTVVAAEVLPGTVTKYVNGIAGEALTPGQLVYLTGGKYSKANAAAEGTAALAGVVAGGGLATDHPVVLFVEGTYDPGFNVTVGEAYFLADAAGLICPHADLASGDYVSELGIGSTTSLIDLNIKVSGKAIA
jgi:hypothetical protein